MKREGRLLYYAGFPLPRQTATTVHCSSFSVVTGYSIDMVQTRRSSKNSKLLDEDSSILRLSSRSRQQQQMSRAVQKRGRASTSSSKSITISKKSNLSNADTSKLLDNVATVIDNPTETESKSVELKTSEENESLIVGENVTNSKVCFRKLSFLM